MSFTFAAIGTLIGGPLGGVLLREKGFTSTWIFGGVLAVSGGVILGMARIAHKGWKPMVKA